MQLINHDQPDLHSVHWVWSSVCCIFQNTGWGTCPILLDITEEGDPTEHPVFRSLGRPEVHSSDVIQVRSDWLLVDGTGVKPGISWSYREEKKMHTGKTTGEFLI